ncbi:hypothetical protein [Actinomadura sp. 6N118]|uniref:hypothetical protein n=1 Tax=Actinomadura sp. 6N118 TaxID=3375151 RepID=UPI0037AA76ED
MRFEGVAQRAEVFVAGGSPMAQHNKAGYADLAAATSRTAATVARCLHELRGRGAVFFDVDLDPGVVASPPRPCCGWQPPAHLEHVATELATHRELAVVAVTTGPHQPAGAGPQLPAPRTCTTT